MIKQERVSGKNPTQRARTARNKIKRIEEALEKANGQAVPLLQTRLEFWKKQLNQ